METNVNVAPCETVLYLNSAGNAVFPIAGVILHFVPPPPFLGGGGWWCLWAPYHHISVVVRTQLQTELTYFSSYPLHNQI